MRLSLTLMLVIQSLGLPKGGGGGIPLAPTACSMDSTSVGGLIRNITTGSSSVRNPTPLNNTCLRAPVNNMMFKTNSKEGLL